MAYVFFVANNSVKVLKKEQLSSKLSFGGGLLYAAFAYFLNFIVITYNVKGYCVPLYI